MGNGLTDFLFARPSFLDGWARVLDFGDTLTEFNRLPTPAQADYFAIREDWRTVGAALREAMASTDVPVHK